MSCSLMGRGGFDGGKEEGGPICLFCPPDVSEGRLRDLALGVAQEGLEILTHLHERSINAHKKQGGQRKQLLCSLLFGLKETVVKDGEIALLDKKKDRETA